MAAYSTPPDFRHGPRPDGPPGAAPPGRDRSYDGCERRPYDHREC